MSAYIINRNHLSYLIDAAMSPRIMGMGSNYFRWYHNETSHELGSGEYLRAAEVAQMLWDENARSYDYRYSKNPDMEPTEQYGKHHVLAILDMDPVQVLKACACYAYQTCEHPTWESSEAYTFIQTLKDHSIAVLPGYDDAEWGAPESYVRSVRQLQPQ